MIVLVNVIKPQGLEPLQFPTKFRSHSDSPYWRGEQCVGQRVVMTDGDNWIQPKLMTLQ